MKRLTQLLLVLMLVLGTLGTSTVWAQEAPKGTFYGAWPYPLPADHHLNVFATGGPADIGGTIFYRMVYLPFGLYRWATDTYEPLLAQEWHFDGDQAFVVKLKEGAKWSDGSPITADDVLATYAIGRLMNWGDFNYVDKVLKDDDLTIRFTLAKPSFVAQRLILQTSPVSAAVYGEMAKKASDLYESGAAKDSKEWTDLQTEVKAFRPDKQLASGPYNYALSDVGDSYMTLYWQPNSVLSGTVRFGKIHIWYGETDAVTPLVLNNQVAYATHGFPPATSDAFEKAGIRILRYPYYYGAAIQFNCGKYPWGIKEVRQAVAMIIDRAENAFLTKGLSGKPVKYMVNMSDNLVPMWLSEETIAKLKTYDYDPDAAAKLLESIGFTRDANGKWLDDKGNPVKAEFKFHAEWADFAAAAQNAAEKMNAFGFDITARAVPWQQMQEDRMNGEFDITVHSWGASSPFPYDSFRNPIVRFNYVGLTEGKTGLNFPMKFEWNGEQIDFEALIISTGAGLDKEAQKPAVEKAALIFNDLLPVIPISELLGNQPLNEQLVSDAPPDDDPIWLNSHGDNPIPILLLTGVIGPGPKAME